MTDQPQDAFPRGRRLVAATAVASSGLLSLTGFVVTAILFALGSVAWPSPDHAGFAGRSVHAIGVVVIVIACLWAIYAINAWRKRDAGIWGVSIYQHPAGYLEIGIDCSESPPVEVAHGPLEARVRLPSGEIYRYARGLGIDGGHVGRPNTMHDFVVNRQVQPGVHEVRWYRPMIGNRYGEMVRAKMRVPDDVHP